MAIHEVTIGIDEVGRGALAGPVVVAAAMIEGRIKNGKFGTLKDSKKLSAKQREAWYAHFLQHPKITFAVARVYPRQIEKRNISQAANLAAQRALNKLLMNAGRKKIGAAKIFLDGGLYLGSRAAQSAQFSNARTIIKADEKIAAVAIASIVAKVMRDKFMRQLAKKHPAYGFEVHKGYGTAIHRAAIAEHGPCEIHRLTFLSKSLNISR